MCENLYVVITLGRKLLACCEFTKQDENFTTLEALELLERMVPGNWWVSMFFSHDEFYNAEGEFVFTKGSYKDSNHDRLVALRFLESIGGAIPRSEVRKIEKEDLLPGTLIRVTDSKDIPLIHLASIEKYYSKEVLHSRYILFDIAENTVDFNIYYTHRDVDEYRQRRSLTRPDPVPLKDLTSKVDSISRFSYHLIPEVRELVQLTSGGGIVDEDGKVYLWINY